MRASPDDITIAIITALTVETFAVRSVLDGVADHAAPGDPNYYFTATAPSAEPGRSHPVVVAQLTRDGTRHAAAVGANLARSFPRLRVLIMCGIAGGVPGAGPEGVHLGDIAVATGGVVDYDHVRSVDGTVTTRRSLSPPSATWLGADHRLHLAEMDAEPAWLPTVRRLGADGPFRRPGPGTDPLHDGPAARADSVPRVHRGVIGSADRLLRDVAVRDGLAARHGILAVEMEASGVSVAAELHELGWYMVRGVADYCDNRSKNDGWHAYASMTAAAYLRALLAEHRPSGAGPAPALAWTSPGGGNGGGGLGVILAELLRIPLLGDLAGRKALLRELPAYIAHTVGESGTTRLHVLSIVRTCADFPGGRDALIEALDVVVGADTPGHEQVVSIIRAHWPRR